MNKIVTFGVVPTYPETGYGYIKSSLPLDESQLKAYPIDKFIEKPNLGTANKLIKDKIYSGIVEFLWLKVVL